MTEFMLISKNWADSRRGSDVRFLDREELEKVLIEDEYQFVDHAEFSFIEWNVACDTDKIPAVLFLHDGRMPIIPKLKQVTRLELDESSVL